MRPLRHSSRRQIIDAFLADCVGGGANSSQMGVYDGKLSTSHTIHVYVVVRIRNVWGFTSNCLSVTDQNAPNR